MARLDTSIARYSLMRGPSLAYTRGAYVHVQVSIDGVGVPREAFLRDLVGVELKGPSIAVSY